MHRAQADAAAIAYAGVIPKGSSRLDLAQLELAAKCDRQCFIRMCQRLGLPTPVHVDDDSTTPPIYDDEFSSSSDNSDTEDEISALVTNAGCAEPSASSSHVPDPPPPGVSVDHLISSLAEVSLIEDTQGTQSISNLLHGITREFYYTPGQVFNTR
jgi:hypothetical protein